MNEEFLTYRGRLNWALKNANMTQTALAKLCNLNPQAVQYLCDKKNNAQGSIHNAKFAHFLKVSALWLEANIGDPCLEDKLTKAMEELKKTKEELDRTIETVKSWGIEDLNSVDIELSEILSSAYRVPAENRGQVKTIITTFNNRNNKKNEQ